MASPVKLYIYDITQGMASQMAPMLLGRPLEGIWHTSIVVYGREYFYGSDGINSCPPSGTILGHPSKIEDMGMTEIDQEIFDLYLIEMGQHEFKGENYKLFEHNCNNFSGEVIKFLSGNEIPSYILDLPNEVLSTPMGQMIKNMLEMNPNHGMMP